jgi:hypothetical protein
MARLCLTVEGRTEQTFSAIVLSSHLASCGVYLGKPRLIALSKRKGIVHRGGIRRYEPARNDIRRWLAEDRSCDAFFTTMIDLYGLPKDFPDFQRAALLSNPYERVAALEEAFAKDIADQRFIPYIQLHEFEALLLSDPTAFGHYYTDCEREINALVNLAKEFKSPELINDGEQTAPSKRIGKEIPQHLGAKRTAGPIIAAGIGLERIREKCPHFNAWLTRLESLATT